MMHLIRVHMLSVFQETNAKPWMLTENDNLQTVLTICRTWAMLDMLHQSEDD